MHPMDLVTFDMSLLEGMPEEEPQKNIETNPDSPEAWYYRLSFLRDIDEKRRAFLKVIECAERICALNSDDCSLPNQPSPGWIPLDDTTVDGAITYAMWATYRMSGSDEKLAREIAFSFFNRFPNHGAVVDQAIWAHASAGNYEEAIRTYCHAAIPSKPYSLAHAITIIRRLYNNLDQNALAEKMARWVWGEEPENIEALCLLTSILNDEGRYSEALQVNPCDLDLKYQDRDMLYQRAYSLIGLDQLEAASVVLAYLLQLAPNDESARELFSGLQTFITTGKYPD